MKNPSQRQNTQIFDPVHEHLDANRCLSSHHSVPDRGGQVSMYVTFGNCRILSHVFFSEMRAGLSAVMPLTWPGEKNGSKNSALKPDVFATQSEGNTTPVAFVCNRLTGCVLRFLPMRVDVRMLPSHMKETLCRARSSFFYLVLEMQYEPLFQKDV